MQWFMFCAVAWGCCRSLERLVAWQETLFDAAAPTDPSEPLVEEAERVSRIMMEQDAGDYWFAASRDGNREGHYRGVGYRRMHRCQAICLACSLRQLDAMIARFGGPGAVRLHCTGIDSLPLGMGMGIEVHSKPLHRDKLPAAGCPVVAHDEARCAV